jgi:ABC-2 type transport system permease protein
MRRIKETIRLYGMYVSVIVLGTMQYKLSFILMLIGRFIISFNGFIAISFLFSGFTQIKGYTYSDVLMCFAVIQMSFSLTEFLANGFKAISITIRKGEFDRMLLRPRSTILQVLGTRFELGRTGPIITAIITLIVGIRDSSIQWGIGRIMTLAIMIVGGMMLFIGLFMLGASFNFFLIEDGGVLNMLTYGAREHGKYPIDIYGKRLMQFCTYIIPYTLIQYYPLQYLLGKTDRWIYGMYPFGTVIFLAVCYLAWRFGMKNYKSCGN